MLISRRRIRRRLIILKERRLLRQVTVDPTVLWRVIRKITDRFLDDGVLERRILKGIRWLLLYGQLITDDGGLRGLEIVPPAMKPRNEANWVLKLIVAKNLHLQIIGFSTGWWTDERDQIWGVRFWLCAVSSLRYRRRSDKRLCLAALQTARPRS